MEHYILNGQSKKKKKKKSNSGTTTNFTTLLQFCYMINREWWNHRLTWKKPFYFYHLQVTTRYIDKLW